MKNKLEWLRRHWSIVLGVLIILILVSYQWSPEEPQSQSQSRTHVRSVPRVELKFGYSQYKLKEIYKEVVAAEDKAREEADNKCPTSAANSKFNSQLLQKCLDEMSVLSASRRQDVLSKYGITTDQWRELSREALRENWPLD